MTMFDSSRYDLPTLVGKLHDQRFDGYDAGLLATEVEKFRAGPGTASMGTAVDALKSVVTSLATTDATLRRQLSDLGVTWQSRAGGQAGAVLAEQAGFAGQAYDNVTKSAQLIFDQGEAFNRTKNKLPEPGTLRKGEGGYTFADTVFSMFGFETDHAGEVRAGAEARAQAVDALNSYAHDTGDYLAASQSVPAPQSLDTVPPPESVPLPDTGAGGSGPSIPDSGPTIAAGAKDVCHAPPAVPASQPHRTVVQPPPAAVGPGPVVGGGGPGDQGVTTPSSFEPPEPGSPSSPVTDVVPGGGSGRFPVGDGHREGGVPGRAVPGGGTTGPVGPGLETAFPGTSGGPGSSGSVVGGPGGNSGESGARSGAGFAGGRAGEGPMGKGKMFGAAPSRPSTAPNLGPGPGLTNAPGGVGGFADSATAIGAGAAGAATSGESERRPRGFGRGTAAERGLSEEETHRPRRAVPPTPSRERTRAILEPAATQDGEEDAEHVRRYGVDDKDLFTDPRDVAPDLIGDRPMPDDR
ncbi:hypothetical protein [Amycolatopsis pigmentata]|uniref:PPE family protein n=1 Tax=Amycolatopsis pigmentata TaxID=450801 RepID=A0ABW5FSL3_9PSEU